LEHAKSQNAALKIINKSAKIDIVEGSELGLAFLKKIPGVQYVVRMHGGHHYFALAENRKKEPWKVFQEKRSFAKADAICAVSNYVADTTKNLLGLKNRTVHVIYNPINTEAFSQVDYAKSVPNRILYVGSLVEKKGVRQLIQAMPQIVESISDTELYLVGRMGNIPGTGQSYEPVLMNSIPAEIKDKIHFTGAVPHTEIPAYLESAEVCVYPSHMEAMPIAWLEALAMGKPFVGSKTGPGPEAVKDGETGLLCDPHNPADIAEKVIWMLQNKEAARNMGLAARADVLQRFNIETLVRANLDFYQSCLDA
jgi:glycosyltransferase involved in cell wall biosynthesis